MGNVPLIKLNNETQIPQLGFGVFQIPPEDTKQAVLEALEVGYRHIDTAEMYGNEAGVGEAIRESGIDRDDIYVTSKLNNSYHEPAGAAIGAFEETMSALGLEYLDLFLVHWPMPDRGSYVDTWKQMEKLSSDERLRSIGVSNHQPHHLEKLQQECDITPVVDQVEAHPYFTNEAVRQAGAKLGIATEAWSPIAQGKVLDDPVLTEIAEAVGRSTAQVTLRWHIQRGDIIFPKSTKRKRMTENFEIFDFELDDSQVERITGLDKGERIGPNPDAMNAVPGDN